MPLNHGGEGRSTGRVDVGALFTGPGGFSSAVRLKPSSTMRLSFGLAPSHRNLALRSVPDSLVLVFYTARMATAPVAYAPKRPPERHPQIHRHMG